MGQLKHKFILNIDTEVDSVIEVKEKICLNFTKFHPENWNPSWTSIFTSILVRQLLEALIHHFPIDDKVMGVGSLEYTKEER